MNFQTDYINSQMDHIYPVNSVYLRIEPAWRVYKDALDNKEYVLELLKNADAELVGARSRLETIGAQLNAALDENAAPPKVLYNDTPDKLFEELCEKAEPQLSNKYKATRGYKRHEVKARVVSKHAVQNAWKEKHRIAAHRQSRADNYDVHQCEWCA